jgi:hypothetical protein
VKPPEQRKRQNPFDSDSDDGSPYSKRRRKNGNEKGMVGRRMIEYLPDMVPLSEDIKLEDMPRLCVERACPLVCINQDIVGTYCI